MKLSEAILLGSTVLTAKAGKQHFPETQEGCVLGMAAIARGCRFVPASQPFDEKDRRTLGTEGVWGRWVLRVKMRPCECLPASIPREMRVKDIITHIFDYHVVLTKNWTIDQLAEWVKAIEPNDERPVADPATDVRTLNTLWESVEWGKTRRSFLAKYSRRRKRRNIAP